METKAIKEPRDDSFRVILTVDKGVTMVVMDKQDYHNKAQKPLADTDTYEPILMTLHLYIKQLGTSSQDTKTNGGLSDFNCKRLYLPLQSLKFYELHKMHKVTTPSGPLSPVGDQLLMEWPKSWTT